MSLPSGFQPRECQFCGSRSHINMRGPDGLYRVVCNFCGGVGPACGEQDTAWLSWSGQGVRAPAMFGAPGEVT